MPSDDRITRQELAERFSGAVAGAEAVDGAHDACATALINE